MTGQLDATDSYATASATWYDALGRAVDSVDYGREDKLGPESEDRYFFNSAGQLIASGNLPSVTVNPPQTPSASDTKNVTDYIVSQTVYDPDPRRGRAARDGDRHDRQRGQYNPHDDRRGRTNGGDD